MSRGHGALSGRRNHAGSRLLRAPTDADRQVLVRLPAARGNQNGDLAPGEEPHARRMATIADARSSARAGRGFTAARSDPAGVGTWPGGAIASAAQEPEPVAGAKDRPDRRGHHAPADQLGGAGVRRRTGEPGTASSGRDAGPRPVRRAGHTRPATGSHLRRHRRFSRSAPHPNGSCIVSGIWVCGHQSALWGSESRRCRREDR